MSRTFFSCSKVSLLLKSFAAIAAIGMSAHAMAAIPPFPDDCRQNNPSSSTECEHATRMPAGFLVVDMTGDSRCSPTPLPQSVPLYGTWNLPSESAAIARIQSNWDCYNTVVRGACFSGTGQGEGQWWVGGTNNYINDPSELGDRDWGTTQRSATSKIKYLVEGQCTLENATGNLVNRTRPLACQLGYVLFMSTLADGQSWPICKRTTSACSDGAAKRRH